MSQQYLSTPARAANVAHYVNIDGGTASAPPGGVPTLAIWGAGNPARQIVGAENVYFPNQTHVQVATSAESFAAQYEFFTGSPPATTTILPEPHVQLGGRVVIFPQNKFFKDGTLEIFEVDGDTGGRLAPGDPATPPTRCRARRGPSGRSTPSAAGTTSSSSCVRGCGRSTSTCSPWCAATA